MFDFSNLWGEYSVFIWPAYAVTVLGLGGMTVWAVAAWRSAKARLANLEKK